MIKKIGARLKDWQKSLIILAVVGILAYLLLSYVILWGVISSESMEPTLEVGDYAINNGLAYVTISLFLQDMSRRWTAKP